MSRYIVTIRKPDQPTTYYLSKRGLRCYTSVNVAVFRTLEAAVSERDHFAKEMTEFRLGVEQLPPYLPVGKAMLRAWPVELPGVKS